MHGDTHRDERHRVHGNEDDQVAPSDTPRVRARDEVLRLVAAVLPRLLPLQFQHVLQVVGHHDDDRVVKVVELVELIFLNRCLQL